MYDQLEKLVRLGDFKRDDFIVFSEYCIDVPIDEKKNVSDYKNNLVMLDELLHQLNEENPIKKYKAILFGYNRYSSNYKKYKDDAYKCLGIIYNSNVHEYRIKQSLIYNLFSCIDITSVSHTRLTSKEDIQNILKYTERDSSIYENIHLISSHIFTFDDVQNTNNKGNDKFKMSECIGQFSQIAIFRNKLFRGNKLNDIYLANVHYPKCYPEDSREQNKSFKYAKCNRDTSIKFVKNFNDNIIKNNKSQPPGINIILGDINENFEKYKERTAPDDFSYIKMENFNIFKSRINNKILNNNFGLYMKNDSNNTNFRNNVAIIEPPMSPYYDGSTNYSSHFYHHMQFNI